MTEQQAVLAKELQDKIKHYNVTLSELIFAKDNKTMYCIEVHTKRTKPWATAKIPLGDRYIVDSNASAELAQLFIDDISQKIYKLEQQLQVLLRCEMETSRIDKSNNIMRAIASCRETVEDLEKSKQASKIDRFEIGYKNQYHNDRETWLQSERDEFNTETGIKAIDMLIRIYSEKIIEYQKLLSEI